jgi:GNAT superfamily N-acetyltransferase
VTLRTVTYDPSRRSELRNLYSEVWPSGHLSEQEFGWWFERNPAGAPLVSLAEDGERLVGVAAMSLFRACVDGEPVTVPMPLHVATHPDYRGRGVFRELERANELEAARRGLEIALSFPNDASRPIFVRHLGWSELPSCRLWARPVVRPGRRRVRMRVEPLARFETDVQTLWRRQGALPARLARDEEHLNWRYVDSPRGYRCFVVRSGNDVRGVAVVESGRRGRISFLAELAAVDARAARALVRRCLSEVPAPGVLLALPPAGRDGRRLLGSLGFLPTSRSLHPVVKALAPGRTAPREWQFALGDLDFV